MLELPRGHRVGALDARVRLARPGDDAEVGRILVDGYLTAYARKMPHVVVDEGRKATLRDVAKKRALSYVLALEQAGKVCGTVALWPPGGEDSEAWVPGACDLRHLATDPSVQGQGLSKPLLDEAEALARALGATAVCLHVRKGNLGVQRLYEGRGYLREPRGDLDYPTVSLGAFVLRLSPA